MLGLDISGGAAICVKELYGDWFRDPWSWFEIRWAGENAESLDETQIVSRSSGKRIALARQPWFTPIEVPKNSLGTRPAVIIDPLTRLLNASAIAPNLPKLHSELPPWCFGWRRRRGKGFSDNGKEWTAYAERLSRARAAGAWRLEADITSFFASLDLGRLEDRLHGLIGKTASTQLLLHVVTAHNALPGRSGLPQRSFVSAGLANAMLGPLDDVLTAFGKAGSSRVTTRWMDDMIAIGDQSSLYRLHTQLEARAHQLGLVLNTSKSKLQPHSELGEEFRDDPLERLLLVIGEPGGYDQEPDVDIEIDHGPLFEAEEQLLAGTASPAPTLTKKVLNSLRDIGSFSEAARWMAAAPRLPHLADNLSRYLRQYASTGDAARAEVESWVAEEFLPSDWATLDWVAAQAALAVPPDNPSGEFLAVLHDWLRNSGDPQKLAIAGVRLASADNAACRDLARERTGTTHDPILQRILALTMLTAGDGKTDVRQVVRMSPQNYLLEPALEALNWKAPAISADFELPR